MTLLKITISDDDDDDDDDDDGLKKGSRFV